MRQHIKLVNQEIQKNINVNMIAYYSSETTSGAIEECGTLMYENLNTAVDTFTTDKENPYKIRKIPGYFSLERKDAETSLTGDYKIHISINDSQLTQEWNIIIRILIDKKIDSFKIHNENRGSVQPGKHIVIYTNIFDNKLNNNIEKWNQLLIEINSTLQENKISSGVIPHFRFRGATRTSNIPEPKFRDSEYCYIRRFIEPETSCCGLYNKSERELIITMPEQERCGLLMRQTTQKLPNLRMQ